MGLDRPRDSTARTTEGGHLMPSCRRCRRNVEEMEAAMSLTCADLARAWEAVQRRDGRGVVRHIKAARQHAAAAQRALDPAVRYMRQGNNGVALDDPPWPFVGPVVPRAQLTLLEEAG